MATAHRIYAAVALGSAVGAVARHSMSLGALHLGGPGFPWATLGANVIGSFVIGLFHALSGPRGRLPVGPAARQFVMAGFCGGLTTFSIFSLETVRMALDGAPGAAVANVGLALLLWIPSAWSGHALGTQLNRRGSGRPPGAVGEAA